MIYRSEIVQYNGKVPVCAFLKKIIYLLELIKTMNKYRY